MISRFRLLLLSALFSASCLLHAAPELVTRVYPADTPVVFRIAVRRGGESPHSGGMIVEYMREAGGKGWERLPATMKGGILEVPFTLRGEGGHTLRVGNLDARGRFAATASFDIYSLREDLFRERPWRGDLHLLSRHSGGRQDPARIAALGRRVGFDFLALTDRGRIASSLELAETVKKWECGFTVLPGESWSIGGGMVTVVAVGHDGEITPPKGTPVADPSLDPAEAAAAGTAVALTSEIRRRGGVAIFCHPALKRDQHFLTPPALSRYLMFHGGFDAVETLNSTSGSHSVSRVAALSWEAAGAPGAPRALVGVSGYSDVARVSFGRLCTVVFAPEGNAAALVAALRRGRCVAQLRSNGLAPIQGSSRLVEYALFLNRAYWTQHDRICWRQGNALLGFIDGNTGIFPAVGRHAAELEKFRREFWYETAPAGEKPALRGDAVSTSSPR